jgi:uncharacterized protein (TIGR03435 family)
MQYYTYSMYVVARILARAVSLALVPGLVFCQPGETTRRFEAADVHVSVAEGARVMTGGLTSGGRYELRHATLLDLIRTAYGINADSVTGGPVWLTIDRFDVVAKAPTASTPDAVRGMLKRLLVDRFSLAAHTDNKPMPAYALTAGKRPQLKPASGSEEGGCVLQNPPGPHGTFAQVAQCHHTN